MSRRSHGAPPKGNERALCDRASGTRTEHHYQPERAGDARGHAIDRRSPSADRGRCRTLRRRRIRCHHTSQDAVYAVFGSKTGILAELLNQTTFGPDYEDTVRQTLEEQDPETRLRGAARIARQIHDAQRTGFDLLRGAGVVAPELARLEQERERIRCEREEQMITSLRGAKSLRPA